MINSDVFNQVIRSGLLVFAEEAHMYPERILDYAFDEFSDK